MNNKSLLKFIFLSTLLLSCCNNIFAQVPSTTFNLKQMLPTSPEAAMLGKFGDIPIGYYTGTADVSIPLYTIKEAGLEIPVILRYHGSGNKVEDEASNVGLGWSLEPGGAIIQIVNGVPEGSELNPEVYDRWQLIDPAGYTYTKGQGVTGVFFDREHIGLSPWPCMWALGGDSKATLDALSQGYGQPDVYQYNFGGLSGKFYINPETHEPVLLDKKTAITFIYNSYAQIIAKTLDGNAFYFDVLETTSGQQQTEYTGKTFKLSKIVLNNGKVITFGYLDAYYFSNIYNETFHTDFPQSKDDGFTNKVAIHYDYADHHVKMLSTIVSDKVIINFNYEDRIDLYTSNPQNIPGIKRIRSVDILDSLSGNKIKSYNFNYDYFSSDNSYVGGNYLTNTFNPNTSAYLNSLTKRLKLLSVQEVGYNSLNQAITNPPYTFGYDESVSLPYKTSYARDYWGYYNGVNNTKLTPDLSFFYFTNDFDYQSMPASIISNINGANRAPDSTKMKAWVLKRITYPTGGYTEFDYQAHDFTNHIYADVDRLNAANVVAFTADHNVSSDQNSYTFTLPQTETIKFYTNITRGTNPNYTFYDLQPSTVTLTKTVGGNTTVVKTWQMFIGDKTEFDNNGGNFERDEPITLSYDAGASYTITSTLPDVLGPQTNISSLASVSCHFTYLSPPGAYTSSYGGGLRVSGIRNYVASGVISNRKILKYISASSTSSGLIMSPLKPLYSRLMYGVLSLPNLDGTVGYQGSNAMVWFVSSESAIPYSDAAAGNIVGYSRVEESSLSPNGSTLGKHVYYYNNTESQTSPNVPDNPDLLNGTIHREEIFDNSSSVPLSETDYQYSIKESSSFSGVKIYNVSAGDDATCADDPNDPVFWTQVRKYRLYFYPINSAWWTLTSKTTTEHFNGQLLTTNESYNYNPMGQLTVQTTNDSRNHTLVKNYTYPYDLSDPTPLQHLMMTKNLYNNLIEQENTDNNASVSHIVISYDNINNQIVQTKIERSNNGQPFFTLAAFDTYGPFKTPLQVTENGAKVSSLIWDDQYNNVIATGKNASIQDISYSSFEPGQWGSWNLTSFIRNPYGFSGSQSYNLINGNLSKSGLNPLTNYIVSYWTKNPAAFSVPGTVSGSPQAGAMINGWTNYIHRVTGVSTVNISGVGDIDEVRLYPVDSELSTFTYKPSIGVTTITDAKGLPAYYEYDSFQRLINIRDKDGNITKHIDYHYQQ